MTLTTNTLQQAFNSGARRVFIYSTVDAIATVTADDYFSTAGTYPADGDDVRDSIQLWDIIIHVDTNTPLIGFLLVDKKNATELDTVPLDLA